MHLPLVQILLFVFLFNNYSCSGFINRSIRKIQYTKVYTKIMQTCFPEDEENMRKIVYDLMLENWVLHEDYFTCEANNPIYTLLWYDLKNVIIY